MKMYSMIMKDGARTLANIGDRLSKGWLYTQHENVKNSTDTLECCYRAPPARNAERDNHFLGIANL
jgi:hypothetical protein